jgi:hypothetical protein
MTDNLTNRLLVRKAESRVEDARKQLKSDMEFAIRLLQDELKRLESHDEVTSLICSALSDLPKDAALFHAAKESLSDIQAMEAAETN